MRPPRSAAVATASVGALLLTLVAMAPATAAVAPYDAACTTVDAVFARGSGQDVGGREATRFHDELTSRLTGSLAPHYYELGSTSIAGKQYPAVPVGAGSWDSITNTVGAGVSGGGAFEYGGSVNTGVDELEQYVDRRLAACPSTLFVLGGYSQGAQVVGETYNERLTADQRQHVVFNTLFGDPKLYLPEGESFLWRDAPACHGKELSVWRRTVPNCDTDNGSLGARKPYLPSSWQDSTGLWCANKDFVCGSAKNPATTSGHMTYGNEGGDVDAGVYEAVQRLKTRLPASDPDEVDVSIPFVKSGSTGLDVVFLVDSTGSMAGQIDQAKDVAARLSQVIAASRGRVALVEYRDSGDEFSARVLTDLSESTAGFTTALDGISVDGGGDTPEGLLHALRVAMEGVSWRPGATKAAVVLTDADYHDPDQTDGSTLDQIAALSLSIDPVNVYPVVPSYESDYYQALAEATTGQVVVNEGDSAAALSEALTRIETRPVPRLALDSYYARPGEEITFDGTTSYTPTSTITTWDWDFDGDGTYEVLAGGPVASHTYPADFEGTVQLRVTDAEGLVANVSAPVSIGTPPPPTSTPADAVTVEGHGSTATVRWTSGVDPGKGWSLTVDGVHVGLLAPELREVEVTDLDRTGTIELGIAPMSSDDEVGTRRVAYLEPEDDNPTPGPTTGPTTGPTPGPTTGPTTPAPDPTSPAPVPTAPVPSAPVPSAPVPSAPAPNPTVTLSGGVVSAGGSLTVTGSGLPPSTAFDIWLYSDPVVIGSATSDATGAFTARVVIPRDTLAGAHSIVVWVGTRTVWAPVTVRAAASGPLAATGSDVVAPATSAVLLLLVGGALVVLTRRRRLARR
ncbi:cutinase family protein [Cellulomonas sp. URHB0016]